MTDLTTERVSLATLRPHPDNPRNGDTDAIAESLSTNGQYKPIVVTKDGTVLAGNHTYAAALSLGWDDIQVVRLSITAKSKAAKRIMLADNRTSDLGRYDEAQLLRELEGLGGDLIGTGYDQDALDHLNFLVNDFTEDAIPSARPAKRSTPVDLIWSAADPYTSLLAHLAGWGQGFISTSLPNAYEALLAITSRMKQQPTVTFVDNEWHGYVHDTHVAAVAAVKPKYATVRDLMTRTQCDEAGIEYLPLEAVFRQAEDVADAGAEHIIVIPKFDCVADIPTHIRGCPVVLGYSVPSSYGRTNLAPDKFAGRPVHLLGGSWDAQRSLCAALGDDVVSLDNNYILKVARYGTILTKDGPVPADELLNFRIERGLPVAVAFLSLMACFADAVSWGAASASKKLDVSISEGAKER